MLGVDISSDLILDDPDSDQKRCRRQADEHGCWQRQCRLLAGVLGSLPIAATQLGAAVLSAFSFSLLADIQWPMFMMQRSSLSTDDAICYELNTIAVKVQRRVVSTCRYLAPRSARSTMYRMKICGPSTELCGTEYVR